MRELKGSDIGRMPLPKIAWQAVWLIVVVLERRVACK